MFVLPTVKLKLTVIEAQVLHEVAKVAFELVADPDDRQRIKNDTIMMAEYYALISKQITAHMFSKAARTYKNYTLSLAIARSIHARLQHMRFDLTRQKVLSDLDSKLINIGFKPVQQLQLL